MSDFAASTADWPEEARAALARVAGLARTVAPEAEEGLSSGLPALLVGGKALIGVSRQAKHLSLVPFSPPAIVPIGTAATSLRDASEPAMGAQRCATTSRASRHRRA